MSVERAALRMEIYRQVAAEMGMPARGPKGSPENQLRRKLGQRVAKEVARRYERELEAQSERERPGQPHLLDE
jgi:hypothetical protein